MFVELTEYDTNKKVRVNLDQVVAYFPKRVDGQNQIITRFSFFGGGTFESVEVPTLVDTLVGVAGSEEIELEASLK